MSLLPLIQTRLEKAAHDNGFELEVPNECDWLCFESSQTQLRIWLNAPEDNLFVLALSKRSVFEGLDGQGIPFDKLLPKGAIAARSVSNIEALHQMIRHSFQLSRSLPGEPLPAFLQKTATMPRATEAERLVIQRVGQDVFRSGLIDYWGGRCPLSGLTVVELLRASHIKPWADCKTDAERLDVFNGLLFAPHLDAVFDRGFMTLDDEGGVVLAYALDASSRAALGLDGSLQRVTLTDAHRSYLSWHREHVFRGLG